MTINKGLCISVEGVDGSGKDTAIKMLKTHLEAAGKEVEVLADLYDTDMGIKVREIFISSQAFPDDVTTMLLITAARRNLINTRILPALYAGKVVILNRFKDSTIAYQCFARAPGPNVMNNFAELEALGPHMVNTLESIQICGQVEFTPDHTLLLTIDSDAQQERLAGRGKLDRYDAAGPEWHQLVQAGFKWCVKRDIENRPLFSTARRITTLDNSTLTLDELNKYVWEYAKSILEKS
jgi:dTMP kinase